MSPRTRLNPDDEQHIIGQVKDVLLNLSSPGAPDGPTGSLAAKVVVSLYDLIAQRRAERWSWPRIGQKLRQENIPITHEALRRAFIHYDPATKTFRPQTHRQQES